MRKQSATQEEWRFANKSKIYKIRLARKITQEPETSARVLH